MSTVHFVDERTTRHGGVTNHEDYRLGNKRTEINVAISRTDFRNVLPWPARETVFFSLAACSTAAVADVRRTDCATSSPNLSY